MDSPHDWFTATLGGYLACVWMAATLVALALAAATTVYGSLRRAWRRRPRRNDVVANALASLAGDQA